MTSARNRELVALVPVALLLSAGFAAVFIQESGRPGDLSLIYGAYFLAACVATHVYLRLRLPDADPYLFPLVALLTAFGLVMVYRIDPELARDQANWFVIGLVLFALTIHLLREYDVLERYRYTIAATGLLLLLAPRLPGIGQQVNGAYLGVKIGPLAFQPAEFAKICIVVFLASYLREHREVLIVGARRVLGVTLPPLKHLGPLLVVWGASMMMLVFIRDLGPALMFFAAFLALLYVATGRFSFVAIGIALFLLGAWFFASTVPHVGDRIDIWLDPYRDPSGTGYQILQSIFAQADGGLFGKGFGQALITIPGTDAPLLPAAQTDAIYSLIVNEAGLFGASGLVLVYLLFAARGFKVALLADDGFSKLLATGLTAVFAFQAFVIIGGVTRVIPLTGVTLPFISYGGSSIVANFVLLALLLLISDRARARLAAPGTHPRASWHEGAHRAPPATPGHSPISDATYDREH
jgi:cell division protein FtsW (lipid II flippase)